MPALETIRGVPIARVGTWSTSTGRWVCTREQLDDAVRASKDPSFRRGVLKLGHTDPRFNTPDVDGNPALGRLENYRIDASGEVLLADLVGVPGWLAKVLNSAYPSRSVEASLGVVTADGNAYAMVVTGLALLGETPPAIESLGDIAALYEQPTDVDSWVAAARVAASITKDGTVMSTMPAGDGVRRGGGQGPARLDPAPNPARTVLASAQIDELIEQATKYAANNGVTYPWVRDVFTDKVIVMGGDADDAPGQEDDLFEIQWTESGGVFTFTGPWEVVVTYTRVDDHDGSPGDTPGTPPGESSGTATAARADGTSTVPVRYVRGRGDDTSVSPEEQSPVSDLAAQVRERLGLPPDADDAAVTAALDQRLGGGEQQPTPTPAAANDAAGPTVVPADPAPAGQAQQGEQVSASALEQIVNARVAAAVRPFEQKLEQTTRELADRNERERVQRRDTLLASAVATGRITPAELEGEDGWRAQYDASPEGAAAVSRMLSKISAGAAVPTAPVGHTGGAEPTGDGFTDAEYKSLFGDERAGV
jgi:hypothetical protein